MLANQSNSLEFHDLCDRYDVAASTLFRHILRGAFPQPHRPISGRRWLLSDLDLYDEWMTQRAAAAAVGNDPNSVPRPEYSLPQPPFRLKLRADKD